MEQHRNALQVGYRLHWYLIEKILGQGGFGITYLAHDTNLDRKVAIKEYLPVELAVREDHTSIHPVTAEQEATYQWGLERFIHEAQTLAKFNHPNIVRVLAVFRENNSAYMVMEYEQGESLQHVLKQTKTLPEQKILDFLWPILDGLNAVHLAGFIHRDIKPANIYIRNDGSPVLLDFGSARQSFSSHTRTLTTMVSPGYAPFEQYVGKSDTQGPWTDIYGLGATCYRAVTGISPVDSMNRSEALLHTGKDIFVSAGEISADKYTDRLLKAIDHAMTFRTQDRPQTIDQWRAEISPDTDATTKKIETTTASNQTTVAAVTEAVNGTPLQSESVMDRLYNRIKMALLVMTIVLIILIVVAVIRHNNVKNNNTPAETVSQPTDMSTPVTMPAEPAVENTSSPATTTQQAAPEPSQPKPAPVVTEPQQSTTETQSARSPPDKPLSDLEKLKALKRELQQDPNNRRALRELHQLSTKMESEIRDAVARGDYQSARGYVYQVQSVTDKNSKAYQRLNELLLHINKKERESLRSR